MVRMPTEPIERALEFFSNPSVGLIEKIPCPKQLNLSGRQGDGVNTLPVNLPGETRPDGIVSHPAGIASRAGGPERKRKSAPAGTGSDSQSSSKYKKTSASNQKPFQKPTQQEWLAYMASILVPSQAAEKAFHHYEAVGWTVGRNNRPMMDWKAAAQTIKCNHIKEGGTLLGDGPTHKEPDGWREWYVKTYPPDKYPYNLATKPEHGRICRILCGMSFLQSRKRRMQRDGRNRWDGCAVQR